MSNVPYELLKTRLWPHGDDEHSYALLDGARDPRVAPFTSREVFASRCLYVGDLSPALAAAAPYLVRLRRDDPATRELLEAAWGQSWGVFLRATVSMSAVFSHFRRLLRVQDERGARLIFRFYDPRVMRVYLPTCRADELGRVFGPVESLMMESEEGHLLLFRNARGALQRDEARVETHLPWLGQYLRQSREGGGEA